MYSVSSRRNNRRGLLPRGDVQHAIVALAACFMCSVPVQADQDDNLVDTIEFTNRPAIVTGQTIETSEADEPTDPLAGGSPQDVQYTEYRFGANTVREYRSGGTLLYIEVISDEGPVYVINHTGDEKPESTTKRSGVVVTRW